VNLELGMGEFRLWWKQRKEKFWFLGMIEKVEHYEHE
jgi:hypothetical protein